MCLFCFFKLFLIHFGYHYLCVIIFVYTRDSLIIIFVLSSLSRNKISFVRLDGTLNLQQREKVIKQFSEDSDIQVLTYFLMFVCYLVSIIANRLN
jgi:superfamily II DNA/RNA helicase